MPVGREQNPTFFAVDATVMKSDFPGVGWGGCEQGWRVEDLSVILHHIVFKTYGLL